MKKIARWIVFLALITSVALSVYFIVEKNRPMFDNSGRQVYLH